LIGGFAMIIMIFFGMGKVTKMRNKSLKTLWRDFLMIFLLFMNLINLKLINLRGQAQILWSFGFYIITKYLLPISPWGWATNSKWETVNMRFSATWKTGDLWYRLKSKTEEI
jgi:hypothetical protein